MESLFKTNPLISSQNKNDMILKLAYFYFKKSALNNKRVWKNYDDLAYGSQLKKP